MTPSKFGSLPVHVVTVCDVTRLQRGGSRRGGGVNKRPLPSNRGSSDPVRHVWEQRTERGWGDGGSGDRSRRWSKVHSSLRVSLCLSPHIVRGERRGRFNTHVRTAHVSMQAHNYTVCCKH